MKKFVALKNANNETTLKDVNSIICINKAGDDCVLIDGEMFRNSLEDIIAAIGAKIVYVDPCQAESPDDSPAN